ncbi:MFS general substrate transporter [Sporormia fimetaria CBS 119925]|uniref:MFS general substrate transporter n=1 Tax=Sporormia fimetaria CBS 119925 TaxID=1340428 RepID=A0A6A6V2U0_9PLEO|nr:MFS general substrate transporter [Sporormia fimetaria CBS 119925]
MRQTYELVSSNPDDQTLAMRHISPRASPCDDASLHKRTHRKLDIYLLPFLALLFLFNSLDKSNIGNAETAHFTRDVGLRKQDLNTAVAFFFAFFVSLQPVGAALGRRYGVVRWVPCCMVLWGLATVMHVWVKKRWQLFALRSAIGCLEAGFYPLTVSYLSLFYPRFEFARRLSLFYGQAAVGGALGGSLSWLVFSRFPLDQPMKKGDWKAWQVLFLVEGSLTIVIACTAFFWLPHNPETCWFLTDEERKCAAHRVLDDRASESRTPISSDVPTDDNDDHNNHDNHDDNDHHDHHEINETSPSSLSRDAESHTLLTASSYPKPAQQTDTGLTPHDILSALTSPWIYHILFANSLSSIPVYAFQVFLPLVLTSIKHTSPALTNLLTVPPYICGAMTLYIFSSYSDRTRRRFAGIHVSLGVVLLGLFLVVVIPNEWTVVRYLALCVLLSGTFIASPLTVAWIADNTPSPGKRAVLLGINGWGNVAGVFSALIFAPRYAEDGYVVSFLYCVIAVVLAAAGYVLLERRVRAENARRRLLVDSWCEDVIRLEGREGLGTVEVGWSTRAMGTLEGRKGVEGLMRWLKNAKAGEREGDERLTFMYGF